MRIAISAALLFLVGVTTGCSSQREYVALVRNHTDGPVTVGFVKDGPPLEARWASPEALTNLPPSRQPTRWGTVVAPGATTALRMQGEFASGTNAFLRVYAGDEPLSKLLSMSRGTGGRLDLQVTPGPEARNTFLVTDNGGRISAHLARLRDGG